MSDLDSLRELVGQFRPPEYDELVTVARKRRRRSAMGVAAASAVILGVGIAGAALPGGERAQQPVQGPSPTGSESPTTSAQWPPERIRSEGSPGDPQGSIDVTGSGLATTIYEVCDESRCDPAYGPPLDRHVALEVTQDGESAVFDLHWSSQPWVRQFDAESVLVQDGENGPFTQPVRYRLLQADGTAVELKLLDEAAPPVPGPDVFMIDRFTSIVPGSEELYLIDDRTGTLQPLDVPEDVRYWGPNVDEFLWGVTDGCRVFWATAGAFEERQLDCAERMTFTWMDDEDLPLDWLRPGRMVVAELFGRADRTALHVSLDRGATWQRIVLTKDDSVAEVLRQLG